MSPDFVPIALVPGAVLAGRYRLDRLLGQGAMGQVWAATRTATDERVALKLLRTDEEPDASVRQRFLREARASRAVRHENVVEIHDVFELDDGSPVLAMELLRGESLAAHLAREKTLDIGDMARLMLPVLSAVGTAHALGIVHRDLKPDNIFLVKQPDGTSRVKVLDFGIAKLTATEGDAAGTAGITGTGALVGTPYYMSPEQIFGEKDLDHRSDIWALGVLFYECLSGVRPTEAANIGQIFKIVTTRQIPPLARAAPRVPAPVARLVDRMLEVERSARPADLREVAKVLRIYTDQALTEFGPPSKLPPPGPPVAELGATMAAPSVGDPLARTVAKSNRPRPLVTAGAVVSDYAEIPESSPFPAGKGPWRQKGHLYRGLFKNLEDYVEGGAAGAIERIQDEQVRAFLQQPFAPGGWYDLFPMITLVVQVARKLGIPYFRAVSDLSRMMAERDLNGVYRTLLRVVSPDFLAPRLPRIQGQYLDFGKLRIGETRPRYTEIFRSEHPLVLVHWYVAVVHGFLPQILGHAGAKDIRVRWDPPVAEGAKLGFDFVTLRFEVQWT